MRRCVHGVDESDRCKLCEQVYGGRSWESDLEFTAVEQGEPPDRAARIRDLAERMMLADLSSPNGSGGHLRNRDNSMADLEEEAKHWHWNATVFSDTLDRLEAEERAKEADRE